MSDYVQTYGGWWCAKCNWVGKGAVTLAKYKCQTMFKPMVVNDVPSVIGGKKVE